MFKGIQNCKKDKILFDFGWFRRCYVYSQVENSSKDFINERQYVNEKKILAHSLELNYLDLIHICFITKIKFW